MNHPTEGPAGDTAWHARLVGPRLPWKSGSIRPADIAEELCRLLLEREHLLEDVNYQKITPNHFLVEIEPGNFTHNYRPLESRILQQWKDRLLDHLNTANSRQGRVEYRFAGAVKIEIRASEGLKNTQARLLCRIETGLTQNGDSDQEHTTVCLTIASGDRIWNLRIGVNTIGRDTSCQVHLDDPLVQQKKLVSGVHAHILAQEGSCRLFDGSPDGRPSLNGTYVNLVRVPRDGRLLKDMDRILLSALQPDQPDPALPGSATLVFRGECP